MTHTLEDFELYFKNIELKCDNKGAINLVNNLVHHSWSKHINITHQFIHDHIKGEFKN